MPEPLGTSSAEPFGLACRAPTTASWSPPAAANTGGALPTPPTSTEPAPMACSMGGPEVKSDQSALNGSLSIRPAAVSSACAPVPAWSPMCSVTSATSACAADCVPLGLVVALLAVWELADVEFAEEQPAAARAAAARTPASLSLCCARVFTGVVGST